MNKSPKYTVLFEASKLYQANQDGVKRYIEELLKELFLQTKDIEDIQIDLLLGKHIVPIEDYFIENEDGEVAKNGIIYANDIYFFKEGLPISSKNFSLTITNPRSLLDVIQ